MDFSHLFALFERGVFRVTRAKEDSREAIDYVLAHATTLEAQERCIDALITKTQILWALLDAITTAHPLG